MSKPPPLSDSMERFFVGNGLPFTMDIQSSLIEDGYECVEVEHLKLMMEDEWNGLFSNSSKVRQRLAQQVYQNHLNEEADENKCAVQLSLSASKTTSAQSSSVSASKSKGTITDNGTRAKLLALVFKRKIVKTATEKAAERDRKRKAEQQASEIDDDVQVVAAVVEHRTLHGGDSFCTRKCPNLRKCPSCL